MAPEPVARHLLSILVYPYLAIVTACRALRRFKTVIADGSVVAVFVRPFATDAANRLIVVVVVVVRVLHSVVALLASFECCGVSSLYVVVHGLSCP